MASQSQSAVNPVAQVNPVAPATAVTSQNIVAKSAQPTNIAATSQNVQTQQQKSNNFEPLDKSSSNTLKRNPKMELSKTDLLKLLGYLEGELQARDIVIAALKSEKMKHLLSSRYRSGTSDPHVALARDVAIVGGPVTDTDRNRVDQQAASLKALLQEQVFIEMRMVKMLSDAEIRHKSVIKELEEEKRKHEHDTAQGDDITYGLEKERTRLKKELEIEREEKKHLELELKKENDALEEEKSRQKQIVLLLLAERKKIIMKYIEERKRSEDLAQILSEEKVRIDSMAEGLEEESKKSLQMEAELEKQLAQFDIERQQYRQALAKEEKRSKDLEVELERFKTEMEAWKGAAPIRGVARGLGVTPPPPPAKPANLIAMPTLRPGGAQGTIKGAVLGTGTPMVSSKVVQPTATVTSVPVSAPTTGIARSVTPGQALRGVAYGANLPPSNTIESSAPPEAQATEKRTGNVSGSSTATGISGGSSGISGATNPGGAIGPSSKLGGQSGQVAPKLPYHVVPNTGQTGGQTGGIGTIGTTQKKAVISRGIPPPVPPNKPVVPPKKEAAYLRRTEAPIQPQGSQETSNKFGKVSVVGSGGTPGHRLENNPSTASLLGSTGVSSGSPQIVTQQTVTAAAAVASNSSHPVVEEVRHP